MEKLFCRKGLEVKPLKSAAGYYIGTLDKDGFPNCRISQDYAATEAEALELFMDRQFASEHEFCNGGKGCFECQL